MNIWDRLTQNKKRSILANLLVGSTYTVRHYSRDGRLLSEETVHNIVVDVGINDMLDKWLKGSTYTASWFVGLKLTGSIIAGDTLASHGGWTEFSSYTGNRPALTLGTVAAKTVNNSAAKASYTFTGAGAVTGAFVCSVATGTAGVLIGGAEFSATKNVETDETMTVQVDFTGATA